jgi:phosphatidate cytidylyltransferase
MKRVISSIALIALAVYLIFIARESIFLLAAVCMSLFCYGEYSGLVVAHGIPSARVIGIAAGLVILFRPADTLLGLSFLVVLGFIAALRLRNLREVLPQVACALLGAFYTFAPWRFAIDLRHESVHLLFFALAINWVGDTAAFYVGRLIGKHKLARVISPNKSWEGAIASVAGAVIFGFLYLTYFSLQLPWWEIVTLAIAGNVAGQFGDLAESAMKRGAGLKDSGNLLPGHGGILDRVDSSLFALPVVYALYIAVRCLMNGSCFAVHVVH